MLFFLNNLLLISDFCEPLKLSLFCTRQPSRVHITNNINACADRLFFIIDSFLAEYVESFELRNFSSSFNYALLMTYYGDVNLTAGLLTNLSTVKRSGDFRYYQTSKKSEIVLPLIFDVLTFTYNYSAEIMGFGHAGRVVGVVRGLQMKVVLAYTYEGSKVTLDFHATELEYFRLEFDSNHYVDWIFNLLGNILILPLKGRILTNLEDAVNEISQEYVTEVNRIIRDYQSTFLPLFFKKLLVAAAKP